MKRRTSAKELQDDGPLVLTIGHSTRPIAEFIDLLRENGVSRVVDVRTIPKSRHNPQYHQAALADSLQKAGIAYTHLAALGGLRRVSPESVNTGWRNASFRGYADYMQTSGFEEGLDALIQLTREDRIALMCAEAVPWRCHRSLIADALLIRGIRCEDIISSGPRHAHALTPFARVSGTAITYPPDAPLTV